jgi:hypothetical protein
VTDRIERLLRAEVSELVRQAIASPPPAGWETYTIAQAAVQVGLSIGLAIAINDIAEARRFQAWIDERINDQMSEVVEERTRTVARFSEALR